MVARVMDLLKPNLCQGVYQFSSSGTCTYYLQEQIITCTDIDVPL